MPNDTKLISNQLGSPSTFSFFQDFLSDVELENGNTWTIANKTGGTFGVADTVHGGVAFLTTTTTNDQGVYAFVSSKNISLGLGKRVVEEFRILRTEASSADIRKAAMWIGLGDSDTSLDAGVVDGIYITTTADSGAAATSCYANLLVVANSVTTVSQRIGTLTKDTFHKVKIDIQMDSTTAAKGTVSVYLDDVLVYTSNSVTLPASTVFLTPEMELVAKSTATQTQTLQVDYIGYEASR